MKEKFVIHGGNALKGSVPIGGAKNAAVAILPATLLANDVCVIENLPKIDDVLIILKILRTLGAEVSFKDGTARIDTRGVAETEVKNGLARRLRASYYFAGALLSRFKKAGVCLPGGCAIGSRPIDLHIKGFESLGAKVENRYKDDMLLVDAPDLRGGDIYLDQVSVGATINIMLAASMAEGTTTIVNAAKEPHVVDTANFLNCMGAKVKGAGTDVIKIRGVKSMHGCTYSVIPDQIEAGTIMMAAVATGGDVTVENVIPTHLDATIAKLVEVGAKVEESEDSVRVYMQGRPQSAKVKTLPYPGFPTDLQQPMTVLLSVAEGTSVIIESIFESRFKHIDEIRRMGAKVTIDDRIAVVEGVEKLTGAKVRATDLRAGAALIVAGLMAEGVTEIVNIKYIDRGYDHIEDKLIALGADIRREKYESIDEDIDLSL